MALITVFIACLFGFIEKIALVFFLSFGLSALFIGLVLQELYPSLFPYLGREFYHSVGGILLVIGSIFFVRPSLYLIILLFSIMLMFFTGFVLDRAGIETLFSSSRTARHIDDFNKSSHYESGFFWLLSCLLLLLFFENNTAHTSILILAISDTSASFVGRRVGRKRNPFNSKKTIEGTLAFFVTALLISLLFVSTQIAIVVSFSTAIIEALPLRINDNVIIPLFAGGLIHFLSFA